jgi:hypothetical protein
MRFSKRIVSSLVVTILAVAVNPTVAEDDSIVTYDFCDADALTLPAEQTSLSSLEYNKFYKLCPGLHQNSNGDDGTILPLCQPRCGNNSNFSFFATRPASGPPPKDSQQEDEDDDGETHERIITEFSGGGACI